MTVGFASRLPLAVSPPPWCTVSVTESTRRTCPPEPRFVTAIVHVMVSPTRALPTPDGSTSAGPTHCFARLTKTSGTVVVVEVEVDVDVELDVEELEVVIVDVDVLLVELLVDVVLVEVVLVVL